MLLTVCNRRITKLWSQLNRSWKRLVVFILTTLLASLISIGLFWDTINEIPDRWHFPLLNPEPVSSLKSPTDIFRLGRDIAPHNHPISRLIDDSDNAYKLLLEAETVGVAHAAQAYRNRRGRHPPPYFDEWVAFAEGHDCLIIEEFFDRIYHDLDPFWAISPSQLRAAGAASSNYVQIRNGVAYRSKDKQIFMDDLFDLIQKIAVYLPDLDISINHMDEPRVLVPWQTIAEYMNITQSSKSRQDLTHAPQVDAYTALHTEHMVSEPVHFTGESPYWNIARQACPPDTQAHTLEVDRDFSTPPVFPTTHPYGTVSGFVKNWTVSQDFCLHPHLRNMHGTFVEPVSISTTNTLIPIFSGSKLLVNNDILLPAAMYWADKERFAATKYHIDWRKKRNEAFWRGTGSGGRNKVDNWTRFHRHRFVSLLNGTQVDMTLKAGNSSHGGSHTDGLPHNFPLPDQTLYPLVSAKLGLLVDWIRSFSNVAFYWLECFPPTSDYGCPYTGSWYRRGRPVPMNRMYLNKYLPDIDGNSFSGRFRAFMMSNSLPIKATIYTEWHDSRLIPWKHFVPMDNTFVDTLSIFEFLFQHDEQAEEIALEGRKWAERVLRKEDMLVYVYRLLLEYARVSDPNRENMGFGQDLK